MGNIDTGACILQVGSPAEHGANEMTQFKLDIAGVRY